MELKDQISRRCVHFTGIMDKQCKAGVEYDAVKDTTVRPYKFPCINPATDSCAKRCYPTAEEVAETMKAHEQSLKFALTIFTKLTGAARGSAGQTDCPVCNTKTVNYTVAKLNGHIWARCTSCGNSFMQ